MIKSKALVLALVVAVLSAKVVRADETAIRNFVEAYVDAFNKQNLDAVAAMWAEMGTHVDRETGDRTEGREAIRADLAAVFKNAAKTRLAGTVDRIRFIKSDVASVEGTTTTAQPDEEPSVSQFSAILVMQGDNWQIDSIEEMPVPQPATAYNALRQLDWLVGNWVDDSKDSPVISTFRWSKNGSFLIRTFSMGSGDQATQLGTQIIGWDPRGQQIRSWTFNADGSFGDGIWSKNGADWLIKSSQTLADGQAASGTYVLTEVDKDRLTLQLIGHEIEGEPQLTLEAVEVARVASDERPATQPSNER